MTEIINWVKSSKVDKYEKENKVVFVATNKNETLFLSAIRSPLNCDKNRLSVNVQIIWLSDGKTEVIHQDIKGEDGETIHSLGAIWGEAVEDLWSALNNHSSSNLDGK